LHLDRFLLPLRLLFVLLVTEQHHVLEERDQLGALVLAKRGVGIAHRRRLAAVRPDRLVQRRRAPVVQIGIGRADAPERPGLTFGPDFAADVLAKGEGGEITLQFACGEGSMIERLETHGGMPLPPYIKRPRGGDPRDRDDYQTLFARRAGAVAAPTAALHFTDPWLSPAPHPAADGRRYCSTTRSTCSISMGPVSGWPDD
jgi:hypothetical protein